MPSIQPSATGSHTLGNTGEKYRIAEETGSGRRCFKSKAKKSCWVVDGKGECRVRIEKSRFRVEKLGEKGGGSSGKGGGERSFW